MGCQHPEDGPARAADPHQKPLPVQGFTAPMARTLRGDSAQSWINFKPKKDGGEGGGNRFPGHARRVSGSGESGLVLHKGRVGAL